MVVMPMSDENDLPVGLGEPYGPMIRGEPVRNETLASVVVTYIYGRSTGVLSVICDIFRNGRHESVYYRCRCTVRVP